MNSFNQIREEVEARLSNPVLMARVLSRLVESLTSRRVKEINHIVGRASSAMPDSRYWTRELPDYQKHLGEYTRLKRQLGLMRKRYVSSDISDGEAIQCVKRIGELTQEISIARVEARALRNEIWYGHFNER